MSPVARILCSVLIHSLFCVGYVFLNNWVADTYSAINGGLTSRGVSIRLTSKFLFELFLVVNLLIALLPNLKAKLGLWAAMGLLIPLWLLPHHPLRTLFYGLGQGAFTLMAIVLSVGLDRWWSRRAAPQKTAGLAQELQEIAEYFPLGGHAPGGGYPWVRALDSVGLGAYQMAFMPCADSLARLHRLIEREGFVSEVAHTERFRTLKKAHGAVVSLREYDEFNARVVILVTNSLALVEAVRDLPITPPGPWVVFPQVDPNELLGLQGSLEWWWDVYWQPFWENLDEPAQQAFLQQSGAPQAWVDFFERREILGAALELRFRHA